MSYTETEKYQKEIAEQYKQRNLQLTSQEVQEILKTLGFDVVAGNVQEAEAGNMNATFLTTNYAVKVSNEKDYVKYAANTLVSEALPNDKVVRVLAHDKFEKTKYEVLVMERVEGQIWLKDMPTMSEQENVSLFSQVLEVAKACSTIKFTTKFGWVTDIYADSEKNGFDTFENQLKARLNAYLPKIRTQKGIDLEAVETITNYVTERLPLFTDDSASFVHRDLHMGNVIHKDKELTAVIDFDSVQSVPFYAALIPLIGLIDKPSQFVEGTDDYQSYKGKQFQYLYPMLREAFQNELQESQIGLKLNVLGIIDGLMWVSDDWSAEWNKEMIFNLSTKEIPKNDNDLRDTYYGAIVEIINRTRKIY